MKNTVFTAAPVYYSLSSPTMLVFTQSRKSLSNTRKVILNRDPLGMYLTVSSKMYGKNAEEVFKFYMSN